MYKKVFWQALKEDPEADPVTEITKTEVRFQLG